MSQKKHEIPLQLLLLKNYQYLVTLHAWIRFYENLLHLSGKLTIKKWHGRNEKILSFKRDISARFKQELGKIINKPNKRYRK